MSLHKKLISYAFDGFYEFVDIVSYRDLFLIKIRHSFLVIEAYLGGWGDSNVWIWSDIKDAKFRGRF